MYVCLALKPCLLNWIDLVFLVKHTDCIMKQAAQMKKNFTYLVKYFMGTSESWDFPAATRSEMRQKHFIFDKWDFVFLWNLFISKVSYKELSQFELSFSINDVRSEGGSQNQLFSKWLVNQRLRVEMH